MRPPWSLSRLSHVCIPLPLSVHLSGTKIAYPILPSLDVPAVTTVQPRRRLVKVSSSTKRYDDRLAEVTTLDVGLLFYVLFLILLIGKLTSGVGVSATGHGS